METQLKMVARSQMVTLLLIWFGQDLFCQTDFDLNVESNSGYEYNVFNAHPSETFTQNGTKENALQSGYFQNIRITSSWGLKTKYHYMSVRGEFKKDYFPLLKVANQYRPNARLKYTFKPSEDQYLTIYGRYNKYETNRPENEEEVLLLPRAYDRYQVLAKYNIELPLNRVVYAQVNWRYNDYATVATRDFYYKSINARLSIEQSLFKNKRESHALQVQFEYGIRNYYDFDFSKEKEAFRERKWLYYIIESEYEWKVKKRMKMILGLSAVKRMDVYQERFGYTQFRPYVELEFKHKRFEFDVISSFTRGVYQSIKAEKGSDVMLKHNYLRARMTITWKPIKRTEFIFRTSLISRRRNLPESASSFLSYDNAILSLGMNYKFY